MSDPLILIVMLLLPLASLPSFFSRWRWRRSFSREDPRRDREEGECRRRRDDDGERRCRLRPGDTDWCFSRPPKRWWTETREGAIAGGGGETETRRISPPSDGSSPRYNGGLPPIKSSSQITDDCRRLAEEGLLRRCSGRSLDRHEAPRDLECRRRIRGGDLDPDRLPRNRNAIPGEELRLRRRPLGDLDRSNRT